MQNVEFISRVMSLVHQHKHNLGKDLGVQLKPKKKALKIANMYFEETIDMPCGYQDAAGDRCERLGNDYMITVHAYLTCKYGVPTKRLLRLMASENLTTNCYTNEKLELGIYDS